MEEEILKEEKPKKEKSKSKVFKVIGTIFNVLFWTLIVLLFVAWSIDFYKTKNDEKPIFCIKTINHEYDDGTTKECIGLGYRIFSYNRESIGTGREFGAFYLKKIKE